MSREEFAHFMGLAIADAMGGFSARDSLLSAHDAIQEGGIAKPTGGDRDLGELRKDIEEELQNCLGGVKNSLDGPDSESFYAFWRGRTESLKWVLSILDSPKQPK